MNVTDASPATTPEDMRRSRDWSERFFSRVADLPISFVLDGKALRGIPEGWGALSSRRRIDANIVETIFEGTDPSGTGLSVRVECLEYRDFPVVEWVAWFTNRGAAPTPILADILALDGKFQNTCLKHVCRESEVAQAFQPVHGGLSGKPAEERQAGKPAPLSRRSPSGATSANSIPVLHHCNGDFCSADGYTPAETPLPAGAAAAFAPSGGRSCDGAFPYHRIVFADGGLTLATGWPAQWAARFEGVADGVHVRVGQEKTHLHLLPGETIRTPRMTVLAWAGDTTRAVNLWRRWYLAHVLPRPDGRPMRPMLACAATDDGEEFTEATEENQIRYIDKFHERGIHPDVWWIDAGWYPCRNKENEKKWWITGTWEPDPDRFPRGLRPVSDRAAQDGADLLLWFEPERVQPGTRLDREHPEWLLRAKGDDNRLLNLGNSECLKWLTDHVCRLIADNGVRIYRQDHNFPPLEHWRQNEGPYRQGMNENLSVQGYLRFWDDLLARNPGLWIDSCASGGRRNDLETMRRSVPLHYTDFGYGDHPVKLAFHRTLYEWIPYFKEFSLSWDMGGGPNASVQYGKERFDSRVDSFSYHCGMAPMLFATLDIRRDDYDFAGAGKMIDIWRRAADLILRGDYYPHTPFHHSASEWVAWQFDSPETGRGLVQAIRLSASQDGTLTIHPRAVCPQAMYTFENVESGETRTVPGSDLLRDSFTFELPPRSGAIWFYSVQNAGRG